MASFSDIIPQFNPYIQQLPVETMVKVGMQKQEQYDAGVQKIQAQIDNIAGLDVIRDVDKAYLQSQLNTLGNNLTKVAAGDFSNFQLVNSVSGMAKQLSKDPTIENAVSSTAWYRKELSAIENARKEGKSSESNIWDFNQKANSWLYSNDVNAQFRDRYTPYSDIKKKAMEAIKALHPQLQSQDIPFEIENGVINTKKIADAMQRNKVEGVDENQIKQAISAAMTPDDYNQMAIDARYQFRSVDSNRLIDVAKANYITQKTEAQKTLDYLNEQKKIVTDPTLSDKISKRIEDYEKLIGKDGVPGLLDESLNDNINKAKNDPDGVKFNLYKDGFIKEFANAFSWKNEENQIVDNPIRKQMNWVEDLKQKQLDRAEKVREFNLNYDQEERKIQLDAEANALKKIELYGDPNATDWTPVGNATDNTLRAVEVFTAQVESSAGKVDGFHKELVQKYGEARANEIIKDWEDNQGVPSKLKKVPAAAIGLLQQFSKEKAFLTSLQKKEEKLKGEAEAEVKNDPAYKQKLIDAENFANSINNGRPITLVGKWDNSTKSAPTKVITPKEMISKIASGKASLRIDSGQILYSDGEITVDMPRYGGFFEGNDTEPAKLRKVFNEILQYSKKGYFDIKEEANKKVDDIYRTKLAPVAQEFVPQIKALPLDKDGKLPSALLQRVSQVITAGDILGIKANSDFSTTTASEWLQDENLKNTRVFIQQDGDNYLVRIKNEKSPKKLQDLKLSEADVIRYFGPAYVNPRKNESMRLKMGNGNTNITYDPAESTMQKSFGDFPGIHKYEITADFEEDMGNSGAFIPYINIKNKAGRWVTFAIPGSDLQSRVGLEQGQKNLNALTDDVLLKALKKQYPKFDFSTIE